MAFVRRFVSTFGCRVAVLLAVALVVGACSDGGSSNRPRAVTVSFSDPGAQDRAVTTASWSLEGRPGLYATYGFGGNGTHGALTVTGRVLLDSGGTTAPAPGPDGLVAWNLSRLTVEKGGHLQLTGPYPIRLKVLGSCSILGTLDVTGRNGANGPAGAAGGVGSMPGGAGGPGGGAGGLANTAANTALGALPMDLRGGPGYPSVARACGEPNRSENRLVTVIEANCGGGAGGNRGLSTRLLLRHGCSGNGGGHATDGFVTDYRCQNIQAFGREAGVFWLLPSGTHQVEAPTAGSGGGAGGNAAITLGTPPPKDDIVAGSGGGGGGGVEIECAGALTVGAFAAILADGGNGGVGYSTVIGTRTVEAGYGGGGAGGSIWLSATSVVVENDATLTALGGIGNPAPALPNIGGNGGRGYIIVRDLTGNPTIDPRAQIAPAPSTARRSFTPAENGTSLAVSGWLDGGVNASWAFNGNDPKTGAAVAGTDLVFATPPGTGQTVFIDFQAAPDRNGAPDLDPTRWYPSGNSGQDPYATWETDLAKVSAAGNYRWVRFRVRFDIGKRVGSQGPPDRIVIRSIRLRT